MSRTEPSQQKRVFIMLADQAVSGGSNVLIAILVARLISVAGFGRFGVVQIVYMILVGVSRALVSDLLLVNPRDAERRSGEAVGAIFVVSGALAVGLAVVALALSRSDPELGQGLLLLAACLPLLSLQDLGRYLGFSTQRVGRALALDLVWLVLMLAGVAVLMAAGDHSFDLLTLTWLGSGAVSGLLVFIWYSVRSVRLRSSLLRDTWHLGWRYLIMYGSMQVTSLGMVTEVGMLGGAAPLGALQGSLVLVRPYTTIQASVQTVFTGDTARALGDRRRVVRHAVAGSGVMVVIAVLNALILLVLPDAVGRQILGASWSYVKPLLLPTGIEILGLGLLSGAGAALNGMQAMAQVMPLVWATPPVLLLCAGVGAALNGAVGCLWMVAVGQVWLGVLYWVAFVAAISAGGAEGRLAIGAGGRRAPRRALVRSRQLR